MLPTTPPTGVPLLPCSCCSLDAEGQETRVNIDIAGEGFTATGLMVTARNFLEARPRCLQPCSRPLHPTLRAALDCRS